MRVFLPATIPMLRELAADGLIGTEGVTAFAVTPALREHYLDEDGEALEYAALLLAARGSLHLLDADPVAPRRRAVVVADMAQGLVSLRPDLDNGAVRLTATIPIATVAAIYVDDADADAAVAAAAAVVVEADLGSSDAQFTVDGADGHELSWYAVQELGPMLELL